jgi:hypothetical protein
MMMHDPFQTYATLGQHYGVPTQIGLQYPQQLQANPLAALQMAQAGGIPQQLGQPVFGQNPQQGFINPQQLQLAALVASNPVLAASLLSNPLVAASLHAQSYGNQQFGLQQQPSVFPQIGQQVGSPFGQIGYPLAPQSWIGQAGPYAAGQAFGQVNPFQPQFSPRQFQGQGISPWGY